MPAVPTRAYEFSASGTVHSRASTFVEALPVTVNRVPALTLGPDQTGPGQPCQRAVYAHTLTNTSNGSDVFNFTAVSSTGLSFGSRCGSR